MSNVLQVLLMLSVAAVIPRVSLPPAISAPTRVFKPAPNEEYWALVPRRPKNTSNIRVATGLVESYQLIPGPIRMLLTLRDAHGIAHTYLLAPSTRLDGSPLRCSEMLKVSGVHFCKRMPMGLVPRETYVALLFWPAQFTSWPATLATDTIVTVLTGRSAIGRRR